jgi:hypothetical protein
MIYLYFYLISLSLIGYGFLISKILKIKDYNFGLMGILGITFVAIISFLSTLFIEHGYLFNSIVLIIGLAVFFFNLKEFNYYKIEFFRFIIVFSILLIFISVAKNHDDFPYYHFPYMILLTENTHPIGLGSLNNGFRSPSSIFFISSMFYLPGVKFYLFHLTPALIMGFSNLLLLKFIFNKSTFEKKNYINILALASFLFFNIFFYRLAEHGTDRSGMILAVLSIIYLLYIVNNDEKNNGENKNLIKIFSILICFVFTIKPFYLVNFSFFLILLFFTHTRLLFLNLVNSRVFFYCLIFIFFTVFYTFINSSCFIFPISFTCVDNLSWSISKKSIDGVKIWFELWAKGGANPKFIVDDSLIYISGVNWLGNWIDIYFFNKISDFILGILTLSLILLGTFYKKISVKHFTKDKYSQIYLIIVLLFLEWFFKHPSLRYGGYHLIFLLFFIPLSFFLGKIDFKFEEFIKKSLVLILISIIIFSARNFIRLNKEYIQYNYNPLIKSQFKLIGDKNYYFRYNRFLKIYDEKFKKVNFLGKNIKIIKK